jgi:hypothetical protein
MIRILWLIWGILVCPWLVCAAFVDAQPAAYAPINITPIPLSASGIIIDYPLAYIACPLLIPSSTPSSPAKPARWAEFGHPYAVTPGCDLRVRWPDGMTELLVAGGPGAIQDPVMSLDGLKIYYTRFHLATTGTNAQGADIEVLDLATRVVIRLTTQTWATTKGTALPWGVYNLHPCPVPGGKIAYVSNRNGFLPRPESYPEHSLQLHLMDEDGANIETIGMLNLGSALHPVLLRDGGIMFSSLENMGRRSSIVWGLWRINPDGTGWGPLWSAFVQFNGIHFATQLADGAIVAEEYYNQNQKGFGSLYRLPRIVDGRPAFGSTDPTRNPPMPGLYGVPSEARPHQPTDIVRLTPWATGDDQPAPPSLAGDNTSPLIGKVTHPRAAPDGHLLLAWTLGPIGGSDGRLKPEMGPLPINAGLYLVRDAGVTTAPGEMIEVLNDPAVNESWPTPMVPYAQIHGMIPPVLPGSASAGLPPGTPFGLVGSSSLYKRESAPLGYIAPGTVTAARPTNLLRAHEWNCSWQGCDVGTYGNDEIVALRVLAFEPNVSLGNTPHPRKDFYKGYPPYYSTVMERLRYWDIPVRKDGAQLDPDGNPDTSFLAKFSGDVPFTFALLNAEGETLALAQTWHQVRPGETRTDCGGCHAHSQQPTPFEQTVAGQQGFVPADLTGPGHLKSYADIAPMLVQRCGACHNPETPWGGLVLTDQTVTSNGLPTTYEKVFVNLNVQGRTMLNTVKYVSRLQARCSPLLWLLKGAVTPGCDPGIVPLRVPTDHANFLPPDERRALVAFIDTGSMVELGTGGLRDDTRPTLTMSVPLPGANTSPLTTFLLGMHDYVSGLNLAQFNVSASIPIGGRPAGSALADWCGAMGDGRWNCPLPQPIAPGTSGTLTVSIKDLAGNQTKLVRSFRVTGQAMEPPLITQQPQSQTATLPCLTQIFTVGATGASPLQYAWTRNGTLLDGVVGSSYTTGCLDETDDGALIGCTVRNAAGTTACLPALLTVR